jgi:SAM-dependent methyltransferase
LRGTARDVWDALAAGGSAVHVGDPATGTDELVSLFGRLGADPRGGVCVEVGCGPGRMTGALAERFDEVVAVDVSPGMIERARAAVTADNVRFAAVAGDRLDAVPDAGADFLVCYLVLQHLPSRGAVAGYLGEFARVLRPGGDAFVQVPELGAGWRPRLWRLGRTIAVPLVSAVGGAESSASFRGIRLTERELGRALERSGLLVVARDDGPSAYRHSVDVFFRLRRP